MFDELKETTNRRTPLMSWVQVAHGAAGEIGTQFKCSQRNLLGAIFLILPMHLGQNHRVPFLVAVF